MINLHYSYDASSLLLSFNTKVNQFNLSIIDPPEVKIEAARTEIYEGEILILKCIASSQIAVEISWSFNGQFLKKIVSK